MSTLLKLFLLTVLVGLSTQATEKPDISPDFFWWWFYPTYSNACTAIRQCAYVAEYRICAYDSARGWRSFRNLCALNQYNLCYGYNFVQSSLGYCLSTTIAG
uniref:Chitin-binding type-2 domain-containing protein n=1 Tax=Clastoptera arizonana TaxID=38151 RepID=A0A1B6CM53_9HEMI